MDQTFHQLARSFIDLLQFNVGMKHSYVCLNKSNDEMAHPMVQMTHSMVHSPQSNDGMELPIVCLDEPNNEMEHFHVGLLHSHDGMEHFDVGFGEINMEINLSIHGFRQDVVELRCNL